MNQKNRKQSAINPEIQARIQELIRFKGGGHNETEVADIIENALKLLTDVQDTGDVRVIQTAANFSFFRWRLSAVRSGSSVESRNLVKTQDGGALPRRRYGHAGKKRACRRGGRSYSFGTHENAFCQGENSARRIKR